jgi:4-hydroxybenzoate polyprenyltransferase/phosphoserine phosphatase
MVVKRKQPQAPATDEMNAGVPTALVADLDGTLIRTDLLVETAFALLGRSPLSVFQMIGWLVRGKAFLKQRLAEATDLDVATLPYEPAVLARIETARQGGCKIYIASASDESLVRGVSEHLGVDGWFASDGRVNLAGETKARRLVDDFGAGGFDYIGDAPADLPVWRAAQTAVIIQGHEGLRRRLVADHARTEVLQTGHRPRINAWLALLRPHQWAKNALVAVPLLTAHAFSLSALAMTALAIGAFCLCASSVYIINDLVDIQADRSHPTKHRRPFAAGDLPIIAGAALAPLLLVVAAGLGALISWRFLAVLGVYYLLTSAYTFVLKRKMMIDVVTLASLYTLRVVAGAAAIAVPVSEWLLGFSMFLFLSLALIKRHSEMAVRLDTGLPDPLNRNYKVTDLPLLIALAASAGYSAIIVFSLYLSSPAVHALYHRPGVLWLEIPLLLYWISRAIALSHRRMMHDDPIVFALRDRVSLITGLLVGVVGFAAL